jgi:putative membrane protein
MSLVLGAAVVLGADVAPLDGRFATHMVQHLLLGDLGPLLIVLGLPRSLRLTHPIAALGVWATSLGVWHLAPLYDAALAHLWLHQLEHLCFFVAGVLVWSALLLSGPPWFTTLWKLPYVFVMWLVPLVLSQIFLWSGHAYHGYTVSDQRTGGGIMLIEGSFVMLAVVVWLLLRILRESEAQQQLAEGRVPV